MRATERSVLWSLTFARARPAGHPGVRCVDDLEALVRTAYKLAMILSRPAAITDRFKEPVNGGAEPDFIAPCVAERHAHINPLVARALDVLIAAYAVVFVPAVTKVKGAPVRNRRSFNKPFGTGVGAAVIIDLVSVIASLAMIHAPVATGFGLALAIAAVANVRVAIIAVFNAGADNLVAAAGKGAGVGAGVRVHPVSIIAGLNANLCVTITAGGRAAIVEAVIGLCLVAIVASLNAFMN